MGENGGKDKEMRSFIKEGKILKVYDESSKVFRHFSILNILCSSYLRDFEGFYKHLNKGKGNILLMIYHFPFCYLSFSLIDFLSPPFLTSICITRDNIFCKKTFVIKKTSHSFKQKIKDLYAPYMFCD